MYWWIVVHYVIEAYSVLPTILPNPAKTGICEVTLRRLVLTLFQHRVLVYASCHIYRFKDDKYPWTIPVEERYQAQVKLGRQSWGKLCG
jgi:hypothetical protein